MSDMVLEKRAGALWGCKDAKARFSLVGEASSDQFQLNFTSEKASFTSSSPTATTKEKPCDSKSIISPCFQTSHSMNNTIEPRLIALLNDAPCESYNISPSLELPPLHDPNILKASGRPLLLEPDASKRNGKPSTNSQLAPKHKPLIPPLEDDEKTQKGSETKQKHGKTAADRALGNSSPQSLRKILDNNTDSTVAVTSKKRNIVETSKDDFVQLPQPPKKHKAAKQVVPPIIIGLFEPPPQAALFPPIASSSFHDSHGRNSLNTVLPKVTELKENSRKDSSNNIEKAEPSQKKGQKKDVRPRKKWTEDETSNLLLGVHKHGIGNWTDILEDPSFSFNGRSAIDLKDRFRTCCPAELRGKTTGTKSTQGAEGSKQKAKSKSSLMSENILIEDDEIGTSSTGGDSNATKQRKSRAHRKRLEDLAQLGIEGPFQKSGRRQRRLFSEDEDRAILEGYEIYGPAWTQIQRDPRLNLQTRQPTDLRDRFRNKHPDKFRSENKADSGKPSLNQSPPSFPSTDGRGKENVMPTLNQYTSPFIPQGHEMNLHMNENFGKDNSSGSAAQGSSLHNLSSREGLRIQEIISSEQEISKALPLQNHTSMFNFKDTDVTFGDQTGMDSSDSLPYTQSFDWNSGISAPFSNNIGEMDISRLLLDESWPDIPSSSSKEKQSYTDINSIITSSAEPLHNGPSFFNMLNDPDQIDDPFG
jgi:hypothetical protein